jgi:hypothetical protein
MKEARCPEDNDMISSSLRPWQIAPLAIIAAACFGVFPAIASAGGDSKACGLLTPAEVEAALGAKVSTFSERANGFCYASAPTVTVMLRVARKGGASGREAKGIEMAKQMGAQVDVQKFGATTCSTLVPPASLVQAMGFNTTCSIDKGDSVAAVEVTAKTQKDMVSIERLRPLAEKMTARF